MLTRRHAVLGAAAALLPASFAARAQGSDKPLKLIVPYPPGGSSDTIARLISQPLSEAKKQPLNFAVTALGSAPHLAGIAVERASGASWQYIPYKGGSQAIQDTIGGQAQVLMNGMLATWPHVQAGRLKLLGVSKRTRMALIPDVPTIAEMGVKDFESGTWQGVLAPAGTPAPRLQQLNAELVRIIRSPDVRSKLLAQGAEVSTTALPEFS